MVEKPRQSQQYNGWPKRATPIPYRNAPRQRDRETPEHKKGDEAPQRRRAQGGMEWRLRGTGENDDRDARFRPAIVMSRAGGVLKRRGTEKERRIR